MCAAFVPITSWIVGLICIHIAEQAILDVHRYTPLHSLHTIPSSSHIFYMPFESESFVVSPSYELFYFSILQHYEKQTTNLFRSFSFFPFIYYWLWTAKFINQVILEYMESVSVWFVFWSLIGKSFISVLLFFSNTPSKIISTITLLTTTRTGPDWVQ